jgi:hypothetical protein
MSKDKKPLNEGYQPLEKGYQPKPMTSQLKPPKGGTGQTSNKREG